ncbi:MAG TPA: DUF1634 domain-containing protein [Acidobacteriaceae bacterium]|jgi:uncharacterized membrane protein|nr:DUF1634 domain-containing protein [Acidobacteriaceae bacterium]
MSWNDKRIETWVGAMLQTGVLLAATIVLAGGILYLTQNRGPRADYGHFHGEPQQLTTLSGVMHGVEHFDARCIIMLGLLVLMATPVARVGMCVVGFLFERDKLYVLVSSVVLVILLYSLFFHK